MTVTFHVAAGLRAYTGGLDRLEIEASGATVGEALRALWTEFPGLRDRVATEQGDIREHVNVFVGTEPIRFTGGLATPIADRSEITILRAVSGG